MINIDELGARLIFGIKIGSVTIEVSETTIWGFIAAVILAILGIWLGSGLQKIPKGKQVVAESIVKWVYDFTEKNLGRENLRYAPYVGTLFMFIFVASSFGLFGFRPITADINMTGALAAITFLVIQIEGVKVNGLKGRLHEFIEPYPFMLPIKIIENITLPVTLALRLFGNIFGGMIVIELWMYLMEYLSGFITSVPFLRAVTVLPLNAFFDMFEPAIQTYIFTILTVMNLKTAIAVTEAHKSKKSSKRKTTQIAADGATAAESQEASFNGMQPTHFALENN